MSAFNKFPSGTWKVAAKIYKEKYGEQDHSKGLEVTPTLIRSRFFNGFNINVIKAVEEAVETIKKQRDEAIILKNNVLNKYGN